MLFRLLLIIGLITYVIYKIGSFFFRAGAATQELKDLKNKQQGPSSSKTKKGKINGGDYIDYEEVK
jgi:flagellar biogenesis protein FliO